MEIERWELANKFETGYLRRSEDRVFMERFRKLFRKKHRHSKGCTAEACVEKADKRLHEQATRLHVLEWEAYGHPKRRPRGDH